MATIEQIRAERIAREADAKQIAETIGPGNYHVWNNYVRNDENREIVHEAATHWDACLIMLFSRKVQTFNNAKE